MELIGTCPSSSSVLCSEGPTKYDLMNWFRGLGNSRLVRNAALCIINDEAFVSFYIKLLEERRAGHTGLYTYDDLLKRYRHSRGRKSWSCVSDLSDEHSGGTDNDSINDSLSEDARDSLTRSNVSNQSSSRSSSPSSVLGVADNVIHGYVQSVVSTALISVIKASPISSSSIFPNASSRMSELLRRADAWHDSEDIIATYLDTPSVYDCLFCYQKFDEQDDILSLFEHLSQNAIFSAPLCLSELHRIKKEQAVLPAMLARWRTVVEGSSRDNNATKRDSDCQSLSSIPYYLPLLLRLEFSLWDSYHAESSGAAVRTPAGPRTKCLLANVSAIQAIDVALEEKKEIWNNLTVQQREAVLLHSTLAREHHKRLLEMGEDTEGIVDFLVRCPVRVSDSPKGSEIPGHAEHEDVLAALQELQSFQIKAERACPDSRIVPPGIAEFGGQPVSKSPPPALVVRTLPDTVRRRNIGSKLATENDPSSGGCCTRSPRVSSPAIGAPASPNTPLSPSSPAPGPKLALPNVNDILSELLGEAPSSCSLPKKKKRAPKKKAKADGAAGNPHGAEKGTELQLLQTHTIIDKEEKTSGEDRSSSCGHCSTSSDSDGDGWAGRAQVTSLPSAASQTKAALLSSPPKVEINVHKVSNQSARSVSSDTSESAEAGAGNPIGARDLGLKGKKHTSASQRGILTTDHQWASHEEYQYEDDFIIVPTSRKSARCNEGRTGRLGSAASTPPLSKESKGSIEAKNSNRSEVKQVAPPPSSIVGECSTGKASKKNRAKSTSATSLSATPTGTRRLDGEDEPISRDASGLRDNDLKKQSLIANAAIPLHRVSTPPLQPTDSQYRHVAHASPQSTMTAQELTIPLDERLTNAILSYSRNINCFTRVQQCVLQELLQRTQPLIHSLWPGARVRVFGSMATGLAVPFSDIDLMIQGPNATGDEQTQQVVRGLWSLAGRLQEEPWVRSVSPILQASIPVIKLDALVHVLVNAASAQSLAAVFSSDGTSQSLVQVVDPALPSYSQMMQTIPIDITIEAKEHMGGRSCEFVRACLLTRSTVLPAVVRVLKTLLHGAGLNVPFSGGLSSYALFLMVCAAHDNYYLSCNAAVPLTEGRLLLVFLELFSKHFNPAVQGIAVCLEPNLPFTFFELQAEHLSTLGTSHWIVDPFDNSKNVSRPSYQIRRVQSFFEEVLSVLNSFSCAGGQSYDPNVAAIASFLLRSGASDGTSVVNA